MTYYSFWQHVTYYILILASYDLSLILLSDLIIHQYMVLLLLIKKQWNFNEMILLMEARVKGILMYNDFLLIQI